ncbi:MAG: TonB-dependent receptor [Paludibacter sp.]|nr:TonB-dependent receptor [Paludibacter sp.]
MEKKYLILSLCLSFILAFALPVQAQAQAQKWQTVQGTIVDEKGEPVIGATVKVDGSEAGTVSDINGRFMLKVLPKAKLNISYIGYLSQTISDLNNPRVVLAEDLQKLDEVVVVGYGAQKMKNVTGAVETIAPKDIKDFSVSNLSSALVGQVNGLSVSGGSARPGDAASLAVRQSGAAVAYSNFSNYISDPSPLYVIDDYISDATTFNNLDASMIESITVLKDAAAAVYGSRAAQGAILVKTKRGKIGAPKVSYSGQFGFTDQISQTKMLNAYNYGTIWNGVRGATPIDNTTLNTRTDLFQADELNAMKNLNYDLLSKDWKPAYTQKHSLNVSGGTEAVKYFGGISYFTQDGNLSSLNYNRWNYRAGIDANINQWVKVSLQLSGDNGEQTTAANKIGGSNGQTDFNYLLTRPRYIPETVNGLPMMIFGVTNTLVNSLQEYNYQAIQNLANSNQNMSQNMNVNGSLEYDFGWSKLLKGLKLKATYSKNWSNTKTNTLETYVTVYQMLTRGGTGNHLYTGDGLDLSSGNFSAVNADNGHSVERSMSMSDNYQFNFYATYARKFGLNDVSALFTIEKAESELENLDGIVLNPLTFTNGQSTSATGAQTTDFSRLESGMLSYVGRLNYSYNDRYLAEFLIRTDASTKFAPQNYWGVFPSLSLGWVMSEESWFKNHVRWMDFFKIRGSFGHEGKDNFPAWGWLQTYSMVANKGAVFGTSTSTNMGAAMQSSAAPNVNAHWDNSYKSNLGFDGHLLKDRFSFSLDGYYNMNRDIFMQRTGATDFPTTVGTKPSAENFGAIDDYGAELSVGWKDKIGKDFTYYIKVNTGYSDNKVLKMYWPSVITIDGQHMDQRVDLGTWGLDCMGIFRSYQQIAEYVAQYHITNYLGMSPDKIRPGMLIYRDVRGPQNADGTYQAPDGVINATTDIVRISKRSSNPYGFTTNLGGEWKGISFSAQLSASWGGYALIPKSARTGLSTVSSTNTYNDLQYTNLPSFWGNNMFNYSNVTDASGAIVAPQNLTAAYPNLQYSVNSYNSTFWEVSSTRVTLRSMTVAYSLPRSIVKNLGVESFRLNLTGQNLLSLYNPYPDNFMDPMSTYGSYPTLRTITMGVNVSF